MAVSVSVSSVFLADAHKQSDRGKIDFFGTFTKLALYATPGTRQFSVGFLLTNIEKGPLEVSLWHRSPSGDVNQVAYAEGESHSSTHALLLAQRVSRQFEAFGVHEIGVCPSNELQSDLIHWVPVKISQHEWPTLPSGDQLREALDNPDSVKKARAVLTCNDCESEYVFQVNLDPNAPLDDDARPFPNDGRFRCPKCDKVHHIKDIEGQVLAQLARSPEGRN